MNIYKIEPHLDFFYNGKKIWICAYLYNKSGINCFEYYDENDSSDFLYHAILPIEIKKILCEKYSELFI